MIERRVEPETAGESEAAPPEPAWASPHQVHLLLLMALTVAGIYACMRLAVPFLPALVWAVTLAVLFHPVQRRLETRLRPTLAAAAATLLVGLIIVVPAAFVAHGVMAEAAVASELLDAEVMAAKWRALVQANPTIGPLVERIGSRVDVPAAANTVLGSITTTAGSLVRGGFVQLTALLMTFYFLFYLLRDRTAALEAIRVQSPLSRMQMNRLFVAVSDTIHATAFGTIVVALVQGVLGGLMFWWLDLPAPMLWGVVMGLLAIIPVLGAFLIWIPAALFLVLDGSPGHAIVLTLWGAVVVGGIDNVLYPMLVGDRMKMHAMVVFIAIVGGVVVFGAVGFILGPIVFTITQWLLGIWRRRGVALDKEPEILLAEGAR